MFSGIDAIVLSGGAVLLGVSLMTALLALRRSSRRENRKAQNVTAAAAAAQLQVWRNSGLLIMTDEDFRLALEFEGHNPGQLRHVVQTTRRIIEEEGFEPDSSIRLSVTVEYEDRAEGETKNTAESTPPRGHLELTAAFA